MIYTKANIEIFQVIRKKPNERINEKKSKQHFGFLVWKKFHLIKIISVTVVQAYIESLIKKFNSSIPP